MTNPADSGIMDSGGGEMGNEQHIPVDSERFARMQLAFERQGGIIQRSSENDVYLDWQGAGASTSNAKEISFRSDREPTTTEVFEEFIHTAQFRQGRLSSSNRIEMEIEAKEKLIKNQKAYKIPEHEHINTLKQLEQYKNALNQKRGGDI